MNATIRRRAWRSKRLYVSAIAVATALVWASSCVDAKVEVVEPAEAGSTGLDDTTAGLGSTSGAASSGGDAADSGTGLCGNGSIDPGEQCDGSNLGALHCGALGFGGGVLACDPVMCTLDSSMCSPGDMPATTGVM